VNSAMCSNSARTIPAIISRSANLAPDAPALMAPGRTPLSYGGLFSLISEVRAALAGAGVARNDRVAVVLRDGPEMAAAFLAVASCCACAPLNPAYREKELDFYLADLEAKALIVQSGLPSPAREVAARRGVAVIELEPSSSREAGAFTLVCDSRGSTQGDVPANPDDVALVLHTSGTTSRPKMVPLTHANITASAHAVAAALNLAPSDRCLNIMPLFHIHGIIGALLSSLSRGAGVICTQGFLAPKFFEWMDECRPTWYTAVPTMHQAILARAAQNESVIRRRLLKLIRSSSASLPPQVMAEMERVFCAPVIESYGMTEASHQMASNPLPPRVRKPGSVGVAAGPEVAIMDTHGALAAAGDRGEIVIRGPGVTKGYHNNPSANESAFANSWFRTGDEGYLDADGYLFITGRLKEMINRGGEKIAPREVDEALLEHPAIQQALAFAVPDPRLGEEIGAAIVLRPGMSVSEGDLRRFVAARLADFKVPVRFVFLPEIPKGPTGKPQRIGLAEKLGVTDAAPAERRTPYAAPRTPTEKELAAIWSEELGAARVGVRDDFFALGGYSLLAVKVFTRIEATFGKLLPVASLFDAPTVEKLAALVDSAPEGGVRSPLVRIRPGTGAPLFCVANADAFIFAGLAGLLRPGRPVYGLHPQGVVSRSQPRVNITTLARAYMDEIKRVEPIGPYFLAGMCSSGAVAYEVARQLKSEGRDVALLAMIDTPGPFRFLDHFAYAWRKVTRLASHALSHMEAMRRLSGERGSYLRARLDAFRARLVPTGRRARAHTLAPSQEMVLAVAMKNARKNHAPEPYGSDVILFLTSEDSRRPGSPSSLRWIRLVRSAEVHHINCAHREMLRPPHVATIAAILDTHLAEPPLPVTVPAESSTARV
jgi:oxalate---CoA ligase